jgi:hypothetical protein
MGGFLLVNWLYFPFLLCYMRSTWLWSTSTLGGELSFLFKLEAGTYKFLLRRNYECLARNRQPSLGNLTQVTNEMVENCELAKIFALVSDSLKSLVGN